MGRMIFEKMWPFLKVAVLFFRVFPRFVHCFIWSIVSGFSGFVAVLIRYLSFSARIEKFDKNTYIGTYVVLKNIDNMKVGVNFSLHDFCYVDAIGGIRIGDNVSIAHGTSLITFNHTWEDKETPIKYNNVKTGAIVIEDDVWIGCGVRIMPGVTIGKRSVVAAGSVVVKDVPSGTLVGGVPAKVIKYI